MYILFEDSEDRDSSPEGNFEDATAEFDVQAIEDDLEDLQEFSSEYFDKAVRYLSKYLGHSQGAYLLQKIDQIKDPYMDSIFEFLSALEGIESLNDVGLSNDEEAAEGVFVSEGTSHLRASRYEAIHRARKEERVARKVESDNTSDSNVVDISGELSMYIKKFMDNIPNILDHYKADSDCPRKVVNSLNMYSGNLRRNFVIMLEFIEHLNNFYVSLD